MDRRAFLNPLPTRASQRRRAHWQRLPSASALRHLLRFVPQRRATSCDQLVVRSFVRSSCHR
jgi:hypothetical protein